MNHALSKPRGYPGDYQMLTSIYDGATKSRRLRGYLDRFFLNTSWERGSGPVAIGPTVFGRRVESPTW